MITETTIETSTQLTNQGHLFQIPQEITYLNCAYMGPLMTAVEEAGIVGLKKKGVPYVVKSTDFFAPLERLKAKFSRLIDNPDPQRIAFQPSVSYGVATVVKNLPIKKNGNIILLRDQFPSNVLAYLDLAKRENLEIRFIDPPTSFIKRSEIWNEKLIAAIDDQTICVACPHNHWADGTIFDLETVRSKTHQHSARLIIDGTQSIGALPFSIERIQPDALICAGYKFLLGPYSCALSYFGPSFDLGEPLEYNWINREASEQFGGLVKYQENYREKAFRYNVGECSNFIAVPMLEKSIDQILDWGVANIQGYCQRLVVPFLEAVIDKGYSVAKTSRANHLFGVFLPKDKTLKELDEKLTADQIFVSKRGQSLRISPHVYNTSEDLEKLLACL